MNVMKLAMLASVHKKQEKRQSILSQSDCLSPISLGAKLGAKKETDSQCESAPLALNLCQITYQRLIRYSFHTSEELQ